MQSSSATWVASSYLKVIKKSNAAVHYDIDSDKWSDIWMNSSGTVYSENNFLYGNKVQSAGNSTTNVMSQNAVTTLVNTRLGGLTLLPITQTAYDALVTKDANTLYVITGA